MALYVLFGIGLFGVVVGGIGIWAFLQTEEGQQIMQVAKDGAEWMVVASQAPGTEELRETGCEVALVSDAGSAMDIFTSFIPEDGKSQDLREQLAAEREARRAKIKSPFELTASKMRFWYGGANSS